NASTDYDPVTSDGGVVKSSSQVRDEDLTTLFAGMNAANVRVTRMRSDLARDALATDLVLRASTDQGIVSNQVFITNAVNEPACPSGRAERVRQDVSVAGCASAKQTRAERARGGADRGQPVCAVVRSSTEDGPGRGAATGRRVRHPRGYCVGGHGHCALWMARR